MQTIDSYERPWVAAEAGSYGYGRVAAGGTLQDVGGGQLTLVGEGKIYDGPWQEGEHLRHYAAFAKYERETSLGTLELTAHGYYGTWRPTEQIPERIIGSAICKNVFCSPDPTARGETDRLIVNAKLSGEGWKANVYGQYYDWDMFSNPTYANADGTSAQIHQFDRRAIFGLPRGADLDDLADSFDLRIGTEERYDDIDKVGVYNTARTSSCRRTASTRSRRASAAAYGELT
jgi:hypothetical protein